MNWCGTVQWPASPSASLDTAAPFTTTCKLQRISALKVAKNDPAEVQILQQRETHAMAMSRSRVINCASPFLFSLVRVGGVVFTVGRRSRVVSLERGIAGASVAVTSTKFTHTINGFPNPNRNRALGASRRRIHHSSLRTHPFIFSVRMLKFSLGIQMQWNNRVADPPQQGDILCLTRSTDQNRQKYRSSTHLSHAAGKRMLFCTT